MNSFHSLYHGFPAIGEIYLVIKKKFPKILSWKIGFCFFYKANSPDLSEQLENEVLTGGFYWKETEWTNICIFLGNSKSSQSCGVPAGEFFVMNYNLLTDELLIKSRPAGPLYFSTQYTQFSFLFLFFKFSLMHWVWINLFLICDCFPFIWTIIYCQISHLSMPTIPPTGMF